MARTKTTKPVIPEQIAKASEDIARFRLGEIGNNGIPTFNGITQQELKKELNHPNSIRTYKLMSYHPAVSAPLNLYTNMVTKDRIRFVPPKDANEEEIEQTRIVEEMFHDMEHTLDDFIKEVMSMTKFGWAGIEKVFRKRTFAAGSAYNDGLIGIKKLPLRAQESVTKFEFDDSGNEVIGMVQDMSGLYDPYNQYKNRKESRVVLPRSKFLLFTLGSNRSNPYGSSPLRDVYTAWKYLQALEELEAQSVVKDVNGLPVLYLPPQMMSEDASDAMKANYEVMKNIMRNLQQGSQTSMILPGMVDPETRQPLVKLELLSQDGKKNFDLNKIKEYYRTMIFIGLGADVLLLGSTAAGSFSLGTLKNSSAASTAKVFTNTIAQVVNNDLIKHLYILNGWNPARRCKFDFEDSSEFDLETFSKGLQRLKVSGLIPATLDVVNASLDAFGIDPLPEGTTDEELRELLGDVTSRSGDGFATAGDGTSTDGSNIDSNDDNLENAA